MVLKEIEIYQKDREEEFKKLQESFKQLSMAENGRGLATTEFLKEKDQKYEMLV